MLLFGVLIITSCNEEVPTLNNIDEFDCIGFTKNELEKVGILHNKYVTEVYQKVDFLSCDDCSDDIIDAFFEVEIDLSDANKSKEELIAESRELYNDLEAIQFDIRNWSNHPFSNESYVYLTTIMEEVDEMVNYDDFVTDMNQLQLIVDADLSLTCFDIELLTVTIEVAKNSTYLWLPETNGGLDYYSISQEGEAQLRFNWRNAARADLTAAAGYFMGMGIGLIVPGTNAVIAGQIAFASGFASAMGGL